MSYAALAGRFGPWESISERNWECVSSSRFLQGYADARAHWIPYHQFQILPSIRLKSPIQLNRVIRVSDELVLLLNYPPLLVNKTQKRWRKRNSESYVYPCFVSRFIQSQTATNLMIPKALASFPFIFVSFFSATIPSIWTRTFHGFWDYLFYTCWNLKASPCILNQRFVF